MSNLSVCVDGWDNQQARSWAAAIALSWFAASKRGEKGHGLSALDARQLRARRAINMLYMLPDEFILKRWITRFIKLAI